MLFFLKDLTLLWKVAMLSLKIFPAIMMLKSLRHWSSVRKTPTWHLLVKIMKGTISELEVRQPIAWCRMTDELWSQLDKAVYTKLHTENTITERLHYLEKTIYDEALKLFRHKSKYRVRNLTFWSRRTKHCIELVV